MWVQDRFRQLWISSAFLSTRSRDNTGRTEFRYAAVFERNSLKRILVEVCDLVFDSSSCKGWWWSPRIRSAKSEDAPSCVFQRKVREAVRTRMWFQFERVKGLCDISLVDEILWGCTNWEGQRFKIWCIAVVDERGIEFFKACININSRRSTFPR